MSVGGFPFSHSTAFPVPEASTCIRNLGLYRPAAWHHEGITNPSAVPLRGVHDDVMLGLLSFTRSQRAVLEGKNSFQLARDRHGKLWESVQAQGLHAFGVSRRGCDETNALFSSH